MALVSPSSDGVGQPLSARRVIARLLRDYVRGQWGLLILAILFMMTSGAMTGAIPLLLNWFFKQILMRHSASLLLPLSLTAFAVMLVRAASLFFGRMTIDSLGEKTAAAAQRDMFSSLIRRDLADLNAVHSGQFVSAFLYDATLMRDAFTLGVAAIFLEFVTLAVPAGHRRLQRLAAGPAGAGGPAGRGLDDGAAGRLDAARRHARHERDRRPFGGAHRRRWTAGASSRPMGWRSTPSRGWTRVSTSRLTTLLKAVRLRAGGGAHDRRLCRRGDGAGAVLSPAGRCCTAC